METTNAFTAISLTIHGFAQGAGVLAKKMLDHARHTDEPAENIGNPIQDVTPDKISQGCSFRLHFVVYLFIKSPYGKQDAMPLANR